jgi:hypothetical protein
VSYVEWGRHWNSLCRPILGETNNPGATLKALRPERVNESETAGVGI